MGVGTANYWSTNRVTRLRVKLGKLPAERNKCTRSFRRSILSDITLWYGHGVFQIDEIVSRSKRNLRIPEHRNVRPLSASKYRSRASNSTSSSVYHAIPARCYKFCLLRLETMRNFGIDI